MSTSKQRSGDLNLQNICEYEYRKHFERLSLIVQFSISTVWKTLVEPKASGWTDMIKYQTNFTPFNSVGKVQYCNKLNDFSLLHKLQALSTTSMSVYCPVKMLSIFRTFSLEIVAFLNAFLKNSSTWTWTWWRTQPLSNHFKRKKKH